MNEIKQELTELKKKQVEIFNTIKRRKKEYSKELFTQKDIFATEKRSDKLFEVNPSIDAGRLTIDELKAEYKNVSDKIKVAERSLSHVNKYQSKL